MKVFATRDRHPPDHCSFAAQGGPWPPHCVKGTPGEAYHPDLQLPPETIHIAKATTPEKDAYSGFEGTDLALQLRKLNIKHLYVGGLATDYCVKQTALDGLKAGFNVTVLTDAIAAVNVKPGDDKIALSEMKNAGVECVKSEDVRSPQPNSALIVVDVQNDFCPGGALAVRDGDKVVPVLNEVINTW